MHADRWGLAQAARAMHADRWGLLVRSARVRALEEPRGSGSRVARRPVGVVAASRNATTGVGSKKAALPFWTAHPSSLRQRVISAVMVVLDDLAASVASSWMVWSDFGPMYPWVSITSGEKSKGTERRPWAWEGLLA